MAKRSDFVIYTASDPDAVFLITFLRSRGFVVPSSDIGETAMVLVTDTDLPELLKALRETGRVGKMWRIAKVGRYKNMSKFL